MVLPVCFASYVAAVVFVFVSAVFFVFVAAVVFVFVSAVVFVVVALVVVVLDPGWTKTVYTVAISISPVRIDPCGQAPLHSHTDKRVLRRLSLSATALPSKVPALDNSVRCDPKSQL